MEAILTATALDHERAGGPIPWCDCERCRSQLQLFDLSRLDTGGMRKTMTHAERFAEFDRRNPQVYTLILQLVDGLLDIGVQRFGLRMVWERLRWMHVFVTKGEDKWKMNDHYVPYYARKLLADRPQLEGVMETRKLRNGA